MKRNKVILSLLLSISLILGTGSPGGVLAAEEKDSGDVFLNPLGNGMGAMHIDYTPAKTWHPDPSEGILSYESLPSRYFPKEDITPIKDQGSNGYCWAYATSATLEQAVFSRLGHKLEGDDLFYPEALVEGVDNYRVDPLGLTKGDGVTRLSKADGYNKYFTSMMMMNGFGPIDYKTHKAVSDSRLGFKDRAYRAKTARFIRSMEAYEIKKAIMEYGAVAMDINADPLNTLLPISVNGELQFRPPYYAYTPGNNETNHIVALVGWDDDIPAEKFDCYERDDMSGSLKKTKCPVSGGFIIKNSWGTEDTIMTAEEADEIRELLGLTTNSQTSVIKRSEDGFCYISYADSCFWNSDSPAIAYDVRDPALEENLYYYDGSYGLETARCYKAATRFTAMANKGGGEKVKGAVFGVDSPGEYCVELYLYSKEDEKDKEAGPWDQDCVAEVHNIIAENSGLYTAEFPEPFTVNEGESFALVLRRENDSAFNIFTDESVGYGWIGFTNHTEHGESYMIDENGEDLSQYDIAGITPRIKAITVNTQKAKRGFAINRAKGNTVISGDVCYVSMDGIDPAKITIKGKAGSYDSGTGLLTTGKKGKIKLLHPVEKNGKTKVKAFSTLQVVSPKLKAALAVKSGKSRKLKLSGIKDPEVTWTSSDESIAVFDEKTGKVRGIASGKAVITATLPGYPSKHVYNCEVTVK